MISLGLGIAFTITILVSKFLWRDLFTLLDTFGTIPLALVLSFLVTYAVFTDEDRFFTKASIAAKKNFAIMCVQFGFLFALKLYYWIRMCVQRDSDHEYPEIEH